MTGWGPSTQEQKVDFPCRFKVQQKVGDSVQAGESLLTIYANREELADIKELLYANIEIAAEAEPIKLIHEIIR